ncbi:MAG: sulfotransferase domain-containing protein [Planctomycetota bacterium]|jgi:hypothetical protein
MDDIEIRRTECVCYPRSGHGLLQKILTRYFGPETLVYCESYRDPHRMLDHDPETNYQKNHDLELNTPIRDDRQYLVQIRYPIESIVSWYRLACEQDGMEDAPAVWTSFAIQKASFWMGFYRRWVLDHVPRRLIVNYADLVDEPVGTVTRVVRFLGDDAPDRARIEASCAAEGVARRSFVRAFKYYGPAFFSLFKGLFASVPGVDIARDELVVPGGDDDALGRAVAEAVLALRRSGHDLAVLADTLAELKSARPLPPVPALASA